MRYRGFTLLELLASMAVMLVVAGMLVFAMNGAKADARRTRARAQVAKLNEILLTRFEEESQRRFPGVTPVGGFAMRSGKEAGRLRVLLMREYLRVALPDRRSDLLNDLGTLQTVLQNTAVPPATMVHSLLKSNAVQSTHQVARNRYLARLYTLTGAIDVNDLADTTDGDGWSLENESSECLYLIMATTVIDGIPVIEHFRSGDIRDTDGDGVPEVLDPWETPIAWMRWPAGFLLTYPDRASVGTAAMATIMADRASDIGEDASDYLKSDWAFDDASNPPDWGNGDRLLSDNPFTLTPLVVSAGPDQAFDLLLQPTYLTIPDTGFPSPGPVPGYANMTRPTPNGYTNPYRYPDPYCRHTASDFGAAYNYATNAGTPDAGLLGSYYDSNNDGDDQSSDNIYGIQP